VRMPLDRVALAVLERTGPLAVSSANRSGMAPAVDAAEAARQLGTAVDVYLDGGPAGDPVPSTIVDLTGETPKVLRDGALSLEELRSVVPDLQGPE
jgi:L-threonylcarbamoyladenylate synthase